LGALLLLAVAAVRCGCVSLFDPGELNRVVATLVRLAAAAAAVLVVTGVPLLFLYDPDGARWLSGLHSLASALLLGCAVGGVACAAGAAVKRAGTWLGWPLTLAGLAVAVAGMVSGQLVRWTAVRPEDAGARGVFGPLGGAVEVVRVGGADVSQATFLVWVIVHVVVVTVLAVLVGRAVRGRHGRWASGDTGTGGDGAPAPGGDVPADAGPEPPGA
jgi:hypothetical protein